MNTPDNQPEDDAWWEDPLSPGKVQIHESLRPWQEAIVKAAKASDEQLKMMSLANFEGISFQLCPGCSPYPRVPESRDT